MDRWEWLRQNARGRILDVGSSKGHTFGSRAVNLDIDLYDIPNFVRGDAHHLPFKDKSFDTVCLAEILEHVRDPVRVLSEARRVGKLVLITVPNEWEWGPQHKPFMTWEKWVALEGLTFEQAVKKHAIDPNRPLEIVDEREHPHLLHVRYYTEETLRKDLDAAGLEYEIERLDYGGLSFFVARCWS